MGLVLPGTARSAQRYRENLSIFEGLEWYEVKFEKTTATLQQLVVSSIFYFVLVIEFIQDIGSGGRDRTADLGVMNPRVVLVPASYGEKAQ